MLQDLRDMRTLGACFPLRHIKAAFADNIYAVRLPESPHFYLRKHSSDLAVLRQVFRNREYDLRHCEQDARLQTQYELMLKSGLTPLIIDAGANIGASAVWLSGRYPAASIAAIEPDAGNCEICRLNIGQFNKISLFQAAIGGVPGQVSLDNRKKEAWGVQTTREHHGESVPVMTVSDVVASFNSAHRLFLAKIDIEGFEADLFSNNTEWLDQVIAVAIETHDWMLPGQLTSLPLQRAMATREFEMLIRGENIFYIRVR